MSWQHVLSSWIGYSLLLLPVLELRFSVIWEFKLRLVSCPVGEGSGSSIFFFFNFGSDRGETDSLISYFFSFTFFVFFLSGGSDYSTDWFSPFSFLLVFDDWWPDYFGCSIAKLSWGIISGSLGLCSYLIIYFSSTFDKLSVVTLFTIISCVSISEGCRFSIV